MKIDLLASRKGELVIVIADYFQSILFFQRLCDSDQLRDYIFVTSSLSGYLYLKYKRCKAKLIFGRAEFNYGVAADKTHEAMAGMITAVSANKYIQLIAKTAQQVIDNNHKRYDKKIALCWNGSGLIGVVLRRLQSDGYVDDLRFLELANLPGKIFCDPEGVNAQSRLYRTKAIELAAKPESEVMDIYSAWRDKFIADKMHTHVVPQRKFGRRLRIWNFVDPIYQMACTPLNYRLTYLTKTALYKIAKKSPQISYSAPPERYIFFPMQTASDSQVLLNSDVDNFKAIAIIRLEENGLKENGLPLVVKLHPAEQNVTFIERMAAILRGKVYFCEGNTFQLLNAAERVVTINSSVGLEALIAGKRTEFLGRSFFSFFTAYHLINYVTTHLVNIDFYSSAPMRTQEIEKIFSLNQRDIK